MSSTIAAPSACLQEPKKTSEREKTKKGTADIVLPLKKLKKDQKTCEDDLKVSQVMIDQSKEEETWLQRTFGSKTSPGVDASSAALGCTRSILSGRTLLVRRGSSL